jgi:hypothetical protein
VRGSGAAGPNREKANKNTHKKGEMKGNEIRRRSKQRKVRSTNVSQYTHSSDLVSGYSYVISTLEDL